MQPALKPNAVRSSLLSVSGQGSLEPVLTLMHVLP